MGALTNGCKAARPLGSQDNGLSVVHRESQGFGVGARSPGVKCLACKVQHRACSNGL